MQQIKQILAADIADRTPTLIEEASDHEVAGPVSYMAQSITAKLTPPKYRDFIQELHKNMTRKAVVIEELVEKEMTSLSNDGVKPTLRTELYFDIVKGLASDLQAGRFETISDATSPLRPRRRSKTSSVVFWEDSRTMIACNDEQMTVYMGSTAVQRKSLPDMSLRSYCNGSGYGQSPLTDAFIEALNGIEYDSRNGGSFVDIDGLRKPIGYENS